MKSIFCLSLIFIYSFSNAQDAEDKTWTCIDENGKEIFTIEAKYVREFSGGLAAIYQQVWDGTKWNQGYGFVNKKGEIVVPCIYKSVNPFEDSVTWVQDKDKKNILIDKKGNVIPTKDYTQVGTFFQGNKGLCAVYVDFDEYTKSFGFINREGKEVIPCIYTGAAGFNENRAGVCKTSGTSELYGFINQQGKLVLPFEYTQAGVTSFYKGECRVQKNSKTFLIDTMGNVTFKTKYNSLGFMNCNLAPVSLGTKYDKWAYVNRKDEIVIKGPYDGATEFSDEGLAIVDLNGKAGLIDTTGKFILEMKYKTVYNDYEEDGYYCGVYGDKDVAEALEKSKKDYFLKDFKKLEMDVAYLQSANFSNRIIYSTKDGKKGFIDREGKIIIDAKYARVYPYSESVTWVKE